MLHLLLVPSPVTRAWTSSPCLLRRLAWSVMGLCCLLTLSAQAADDAAAKKALEKLQGTWQMLSYTDDGKVDPQFQDARQTFDGENYVVKVGDKVIRRGKLKLDPGHSPAHIDLLPVIGKYKDKTLSGIYELDGDKLRTCFAEPGQPRPAKFDASAGTQHSLVMYVRAK